MMPQDPQQPWRQDQPYYQGQQPQYAQQYPPPPYPPQGQPYGQPPGRPPRPPRRTGRKILIGIAAAFGLIIVIGIIGAAAGGGKTAPSSAQSSAPPTTAAPAATHSSAKARPAAAPTVTYVVTGSSADVTYGPAGSSLNGTVPMRIKKKLGHALYYSVEAQLNGGGEVTVKILVNGKVISTAHASGGYNIAMAEISQNPITGKWESTQG